MILGTKKARMNPDANRKRDFTKKLKVNLRTTAVRTLFSLSPKILANISAARLHFAG